MEQVVEPANLRRALRKVVSNKGKPGIDGMTVLELEPYLDAHETELCAQLLRGRYRPSPVRRVTIPKPSGGKRELGIPTVVDRLVQQAILQVLTPLIDPTFSDSSYGFRPGRSAHQAAKAAQGLAESGLSFVVDIDLEKFFDRVNHDVLMGRLAKRIQDKFLLKVLRAFLNAGVMANGVKVGGEEGTPQGGPLSPLLANVLLDDLDKELEARGHRFARYADDCNVYVSTERAAQRVMDSVTKFLEVRLRLRVNRAKSAIGSPAERRFPGIPD
jgi:RNA-directed DNA polymerase